MQTIQMTRDDIEARTQMILASTMAGVSLPANPLIACA